MRNDLQNDILTIYFEGELNSFNADNIEKEIKNDLEGKKFKSLVFDFSNLRYISSAGLRVILKYKQLYNDVQVVEASLEVYDVLSMTGFTNIMEVKKAMKRLYVSGAEIVGDGFFSTVYRIDKDTIVKVFNRTSDPNQIERELRLAKQAFVLGIPTAISYDIVKVDDKLGVRFEMLDCISLKNAFLQYPERYDELVDKYVSLLKNINQTDSNGMPGLPDMKEFFFRKLAAIKDILEPKYYDKAYKMLKGIEDRSTFIHGDCHFKNIMIQGDEFLLIDMDTLSHGHPMFELALIRVPYVAFEEDCPGNNEQFLGVPAPFSKKLYEDVVTRYYGKNDQEIFDKLAILSCIHMLWWNITNSPDYEPRFTGNKARLYKLLDKYDDLMIGD